MADCEGVRTMTESDSDITRFIADLRTDDDLQAEMKAKGAGVDALVKIAQARGYNVTADEVEKHLKAGGAEITEEKLDNVVGRSLSKPSEVPGLGGGMSSFNFNLG
jgi:predicted ribosomally synthesized peptide with nif11-like leader